MNIIIAAAEIFNEPILTTSETVGLVAAASAALAAIIVAIKRGSFTRKK